MQGSGKYITLYQRKTGDTWRMARDVGNSSAPPPGRSRRGYPRKMDQMAT